MMRQPIHSVIALVGVLLLSPLLLMLAVQFAYLADYYNSRPERTRCLTYPFAPCWTKL